MKRVFGLTIMMAVAICLSASAASIAKIAAFRGDVKVAQGGKAAVAVAAKGFAVNAGDKITTGANGTARIVYPDGSYADVSPNTELALKAGEMDVTTGSVRADIKKGSKVLRRFVTPSGVAAVKGTILKVTVMPDGRFEVACDRGEVLVQDVGQATLVTLPGGQAVQLQTVAGGQVQVAAVRGNVTVQTAGTTLTVNKGSVAGVKKTAGGEQVSAVKGNVAVKSNATGQTTTVKPGSAPATVGAGGAMSGGTGVTGGDAAGGTGTGGTAGTGTGTGGDTAGGTGGTDGTGTAGGGAMDALEGSAEGAAADAAGDTATDGTVGATNQNLVPDVEVPTVPPTEDDQSASPI